MEMTEWIVAGVGDKMETGRRMWRTLFLSLDHMKQNNGNKGKEFA